MANPTAPTNSKIVDNSGLYLKVDGVVDANGNVVQAAQQSNIADPAAITATNPDAPTAYTAHSSGSTPVTSDAATDLDTTAAALETLRDEVATYETAISALVADVTELRTAIVAIIAALEAHGLTADA